VVDIEARVVTETAKPRVVILGGGVGAMTAAFELSREGWRDRYESITVYQLGWRLGGKGASGRGDNGRIEEHGLHVWLGFYENAFRMMRECYDELNATVSKPDGDDWGQLASIDSAFMRSSMIVGEERLPSGWVPWVVEFPENDEEPGRAESNADLPDAWQYLERAVLLAASFLRSAVRRAQPQRAEGAGVRVRGLGAAMGATSEPGVYLRQAAGPAAGRAWRAATGAVWRAEDDVTTLTNVVLSGVLALLDDLAGEFESHEDHDHSHDRLAGWLGELARTAQVHMKADVQASDDARREWYLADVLLACARGIIGHGLLRHPDGFDAIDEFDFADWLVLNGADPESAHCTMVRTAAYDLPFAYRDGEAGKAALSAGTGLRGMCRMFFTYKGSIAWKMRAGMGDIVFAPLYLVLRERGVDFRFFQRVTRVRVAADDPQLIEAIEFDRQVPEAVSADYQPLVTVKGRPCWPARPLLDIDDPSSLEESVVDAPADPWELEVGPADKVVLGIPVGVLPTICADLIRDHPEWHWMVSKVETVATQAFQLWLGESAGELGAEGAPARPLDVAENLRFLTSGGYVEPFDTWADMSHLIDVEDWPDAHRPRGIVYLCNVLPGVDPRKRHSQSQWDAEVKRNAERFLRHHALHVWPGAISRYPDEFRWDLLVDPGGGVGRERFDAQFFRANVDPSERYVLSVPGSGRTRLAPDESGYENLFLAGDWTRCGLDLGCVEAAVMSGMLAAAAVEGDADVDHIVGAGHL